MKHDVAQTSEPRDGVASPGDQFDALFASIAAGAALRDRERQHPFDVVEQLRARRFAALRLPIEQGGAGLSLRELMGLVVRLGEADTNVAHIYRNHFVTVERFLLGHDDHRHEALRLAVRNGALIGLATTELDRAQTGGATAFKTTLADDGDFYRLDGTKYYSTGALYADWVMVRAHHAERGPVTVVIPTDRAGIERVDDWDGIGQRVTGTGTTNLTNVRVEPPEVTFERETPAWLTSAASTLAQLYLTTVNAGILRAVLRDAKALLVSRTRTFYYAAAEKAADDPLLLQTIGRIASEAFVAELAVLAAAEALDRVAASRLARLPDDAVFEHAHEASLTAAKAKVIIDELVLRSATALFDVGGASAATARKNLDRHWRNARTLASHNPANSKAHHIGNYEVNGARLPGIGFF